MTISAHPLQWPEGWPRTQAARRIRAKFSAKTQRTSFTTYSGQRSLTLAEGRIRVMEELGRMGVKDDDIVISTDVRLRLDGLPRSGEPEPKDPGAAVYWETKKGERRVMAIDQYTKVADNLAAIGATLAAMRAIERHGGAQILDRAFTGFAALPAPSAGDKREWWEVLDVNPEASGDEIKAAYRKLAAKHHPDKGGDPDIMAEVNRAYEEAQA